MVHISRQLQRSFIWGFCLIAKSMSNPAPIQEVVCFCVSNCVWVCFKSAFGLKKHQINAFFSVFRWFSCADIKTEKQNLEKKNHFDAFSSENTLYHNKKHTLN
jgi:hypothetical protein